MKRIKLVGKTLPKIKLPDYGVPEIDPAEFATAIGATSGDSPMIVQMRRELGESLRSRGGRPGIEGAELRPKIPMSEADWERLETLAKRLATDDVVPTPGQVASRLLHDALDRCETPLTPAKLATRAGEAPVTYASRRSSAKDAARQHLLVATERAEKNAA